MGLIHDGSTLKGVVTVPGTKELKSATVDEIGGLVCPNCGASVPMPMNTPVSWGRRYCMICRTGYDVTIEASHLSNQRRGLD